MAQIIYPKSINIYMYIYMHDPTCLNKVVLLLLLFIIELYWN